MRSISPLLLYLEEHNLHIIIMNLCHFAKVIIGRSTKDQSEIKYYEDFINGRQNEHHHKASRFDTTFSGKRRYLFYAEVMHKYPKMHMPLEVFVHKLTRIQTYLAKSKYYKNHNKSGEKKYFVDSHNLTSWLNLSEDERRSHRLQDCSKCQENESTDLHVSLSSKKEEKQWKKLSETVIDSLSSVTSPRGPDKTVQDFLSILHPMLEEKLGVDLKLCVEKSLNVGLQGKKTTAKRKERAATALKEKTNLQNILVTPLNEKDDRENSSYGISRRKRRNKFHETPKSANKSDAPNDHKMKLNLQKVQKYRGKSDNNGFNKSALLLRIGETRRRNVNWKSFGGKYNTRNKNGDFPTSGHTLKDCAVSNGVNKVNLKKLVSGSKGAAQRVLRKYLRVCRGLTVHRPRAAPQRRLSLRRKRGGSGYNIGIDPAVRVFENTKISNTGAVNSKKGIFDRKFPGPRTRGRAMEKQDFLRLLGIVPDVP
jgi:hypothetical protein